MSGIRAAGGGRHKADMAVGDLSITGKPKCPKDRLIDDVAISAWHSNLGIMFDRKSFSAEDVPHLINYCNAISRVMQMEEKIAAMDQPIDFAASGSAKVHPLVTIHNIWTNQSLKLADRLGLTPMARARIISGANAGKSDTDDDFQEF